MLMISDLTVNNELDRNAMASISGGTYKIPEKRGHGHFGVVPFIYDREHAYESFSESSLSLEAHNVTGVSEYDRETLIVGLPTL